MLAMVQTLKNGAKKPPLVLAAGLVLVPNM